MDKQGVRKILVAREAGIPAQDQEQEVAQASASKIEGSGAE